MKIALLTRHFSFVNAGIGRVGIEILKRLKERGHEVVPVSAGDTYSNWQYFGYTAWGIRRQIPGDADVYHCLTPMESIHAPKDKTVCTILDLIPMAFPSLAGSGMGGRGWRMRIGQQYFTFAAHAAANSARIAAISTLTAEHINEYLNVPLENIAIIPLGIREDLKPKAKEDNVFRIGYLGQLDRRKRVDLLIEAFKDSTSKGQLVIAGTGIDEVKLKSQAGGDPRIVFQGFIPDDKLCDWYNNISALVHPSAIEGYGLTCVEAMACKKPVIVFKDAIIPDEVKIGCYQVSRSSLLDLFNTWNGGHFFDWQEKWIEINYRFAAGHNWDNCVNEYEKLYKEVANGYSNKNAGKNLLSISPGAKA